MFFFRHCCLIFQFGNIIFRNSLRLMQKGVAELAFTFPDIPYTEMESRSQNKPGWGCLPLPTCRQKKGTSAFYVSQPRQSRICPCSPMMNSMRYLAHPQKAAVTWDLKMSPSSVFPFSSVAHCPSPLALSPAVASTHMLLSQELS